MFTPHLISGHPGDQNVSIADAMDANLIVIGSLDKSKLDHLLLGSVSSYVVNYNKTNIMLVRT